MGLGQIIDGLGELGSGSAAERERASLQREGGRECSQPSLQPAVFLGKLGAESLPRLPHLAVG